MDSSPIPSPTFTNATHSTAFSSASSLRINAKVCFADIKNVILGKAKSFRVQRAKCLMMVANYEALYEEFQAAWEFACGYLLQTSNPHALRLAAEIDQTFRPIHTEFKAYVARMNLTINAFNTLTKLEHRSIELETELARLVHSWDSGHLAETSALRNAFELKREEYQEFQLTYIAWVEKVCEEVLHGLRYNIHQHQRLIAQGVASVAQSVHEFPDSAQLLSLVSGLGSY